MVRPTLIKMNLVKLKYYPFIISYNRCTRICSVLSPKMYVPKETKYLNVKAFNVIKNKNEVKAMFQMLVNVNSIAEYVIQIKNGVIKQVNVEVKVIVSAEKVMVGILAHVFERM